MFARLHTAAMLSTLLRFCVAGFLAIIVTILLLLLMRAMLGGFADPDENFFTRLFMLNTVELPPDSNRPFKPAPVQEQPDLPQIEGLNIREEAESFLGNQESPVAVSPDVSFSVEKPAVVRDTGDESRITGSDLEDRRKEIISILEADAE